MLGNACLWDESNRSPMPLRPRRLKPMHRPMRPQPRRRTMGAMRPLSNEKSGNGQSPVVRSPDAKRGEKLRSKRNGDLRVKGPPPNVSARMQNETASIDNSGGIGIARSETNQR